MSTLPSLSASLDSTNPSSGSLASKYLPNSEQLKTAEDTDKVAKNFEALLIHSMLKAMRTTTLGDKPSNARAMYDDMYDQHLSKLLSESGGLGVASAISRQLNAQQGINLDKSQSVPSNIDHSMLALSNHPSTLARNGQVTSSFNGLEQYQSLSNRTEANVKRQNANMGSITHAALNLSATQDANSLSETKQYFIDTLLPDAKRNAARLGIQPDIIIAIAALETGWGKYVIKEANGASSNNLFGIKAHNKELPYTMHKTTEYINDTPVTVAEPFRKFDNTAAAVNGFADFLLSNPRYKKALDSSNDNSVFLQELQRAGYATDPEYANKAIEVLRQIQAIRQRPTP